MADGLSFDNLVELLGQDRAWQVCRVKWRDNVDEREALRQVVDAGIAALFGEPDPVATQPLLPEHRSDMDDLSYSQLVQGGHVTL